MGSLMVVFSTKVLPLIRRSMMNDPRPDIAIGHVRLLVGNVAKTTDFFVKLGIRTIVEQADFAVLELRGGTHLVLRTWEEPEVALYLSISWWMTWTPLMCAYRAMTWTSRTSAAAASTIIARSRHLIVAR
jgi:hypothetical protein